MGRGCGGKRGLASAAHRSPSSPDTPTCSAAPRARQSHIHAPLGARGRERPPAAGRGGSHPTGTHPCHSLGARGEHPWGGCACWLPGRVCRAGALGRDECPEEPGVPQGAQQLPSTGWHCSHCSHQWAATPSEDDQYLGGQSHGNVPGGARKTNPKGHSRSHPG